MPTMFRDSVRALLALAALTLVCGVAFPLVVWGVGQVAFSSKADGSLVKADGRVVGSSLIGQEWKGAQWFHGRASAGGYDASGSGGSNLGPNSADLAAAVKERLAAVAKENGVSPSPGAGRPRDGIGLGPRSGRLAAGRADPGEPRRARARHRAGDASSSSSAATCRTRRSASWAASASTS